MSTSIAIEPPRQPEVETLLRLSAEFAGALYPPEHNFLLGIDELELPEVTFYVARSAGAEARGIAALVQAGPGRAELKRMFVHPDARGQGIATALLERIETDAAIRGIREIVLETGPLHDDALKLYRKHGYREVPQFGPYVGEPYSVCFAKAL